MRSAEWWRRNRLWLALLVPLLALALAASSYRLTTLYLPWQWSRPQVVARTGTFTQTFRDTERVTWTRTVTVTVQQVARTTVVAGEAAAPGAQLWLVELEFAAAPDQLLDGCTIELEDAAGTIYGGSGAKVDRAGRPQLTAQRSACVPQDAPGPTRDFTGELVPSPIERPPRWTSAASLALPGDVEPVAVRVLWDKPDYLKLTLTR